MSSDKNDEVFGISDNSSSSENDSKNDEEYSPDKLLRGALMNRPLRLSNNPGPGVPGTSGSVPALEASPDSVLERLKYIEQTIGTINKSSLKNRYPNSFLDILDAFRGSLDGYNITLGVLDPTYSEDPEFRTDPSKSRLLNIHIQIADFYAYIVLEYLKLLNKAKRSEETKNIVTKILGLFEKLGTRDEIAKKIHLRSLAGNNETNFSLLVPLRITNDAILKQLKKSLKKKKKKSKQLCSVKRLADFTFYENHFDHSKVVFLINTIDIPARGSIEEKPPSKNKKAKKSKKAKKKSKSAKKVAEKSKLTSDMGLQQSSNKPDSVPNETESVSTSNETESVLKSASNETASVSKSASNEAESVSKSASNETESVSKSASNETESVSKSASNETESVSKSASNETESVSKSASNETESVLKSASNETESVSKSASNETESVSKSASNETESVSKSASNETESFSKSASNETESVSKSVSDETESVSKSASNETESVSKSASNETESVSKSSSNETESVSKSVSDEIESVSKSASNETESVSKSASNETESVSKSALNETESVFNSASNETASVSKSASNEIESVSTSASNETESVSKSVSDETESVSKSASDETESVSNTVSNETESVSKSASNETESVSNTVSNETESVSKSASNETESVSKSALNETESVSNETQLVSTCTSNQTESVEESTELRFDSMEMKVLKISNYYSSYNLSSILFSQLSNCEMESETTEDEAEQLMKLGDFSIMKLIILLNTLQFDIKNFEVEYSVGAVETFKDYLKTLHHVNKFIVMMQNEFSTNKNPEFEEFFLPVSKMCQSHLLALILCQSAEFLKSSSGQNDDNEDTTYSEFIQLVDVFGKSEDILEKLQYRNDDIFTELAKQACVVMPLTSIYSSNEDIIEYVSSINESKEKIVMKPPQICVHYMKIPCAFGPPRCTEFNYLPINMEQLTKLLELQFTIYKSNCDINNFYKESDDLREFVQTLKAFEEFKERKLKNVTFVHSFLDTIENTLSHHILRIFVSQFYTFIFHILLDHYSKSTKLENKTDAKHYRRIILDLFTVLCPVYQIPEKLSFRNDEFFSRYTYSLFNVRALVITYTSKQLCKNISSVIRESRPYLETFHKGYISRPMGLRKQINILEKKFCFNDRIFYIDIQENGSEKSVHFRELANEILKAKLS